MVPQSLEGEYRVRKHQLRLRNWFTLFWLLAFSFVSQELAFGLFDIPNASGGVRLLMFLGGFALFLGGFVAFDHLLAHLYPNSTLGRYETPRRGRQI